MFFNDEEIKEKVLYYAPYLTSEIMEKMELRSSYLLGYMSRIENKEKIKPSFLYAPKKEDIEWIFQGQTIEFDDKDDVTINKWFEDAISEIEEELPIIHRSIRFHIEDEDESPMIARDDMPEPQVEYSSTPHIEEKLEKERIKKENTFWEKAKKGLKQFGKSIVEEEDSATEYPSVAEEDSLDEIREENVKDVIEDLNRAVERLRLKGMSLGAIVELVVKGEPISKLHITEDNRLFLSDYLDMEIELGARYKAVYFLFLNHPEGIILKRLEDYHTELVNYYKQTFGYNELPHKLMENIKNLEVPGNNQINVVIWRIRKAFESLFDEHLARHYIITGKQGGLYKIPLDQKLIEWEDEYE
jgi:hypothetical protein